MKVIILSLVTALLSPPISQALNEPPPIAEALGNIAARTRANQDGYATFWDGNIYVQCHQTATLSIFCEAAGANAAVAPQRAQRRAAQVPWLEA